MNTFLEVRSAGPDDRLPLARMLELYQHELSDIWDQDLDTHGEYGYALDRFWARDSGGKTHHAFIVRADGRLAGFALVDEAVKVHPQQPGRWMAQFFILKKYRQRGIGARTAAAVFAALPGRWEVGQMMANEAAQAFWRQVIGAYGSVSYVEHRLTEGAWQGVVQCFDNSPALSAADA